MAKYRAKKDVPPNIKAGDEVEFKDKLIPEFEDVFEPAGNVVVASEDEDTDDGKLTGHPSREDLKAQATELGVVFASNIPTAKLVELVEEAKAAKAAEEDEAGEGEKSEDGEKADEEGDTE